MMSAIVLGLLLGVGIGMWLMDWRWRWSIHEDARRGQRLEADGKFYNLTEDQAPQPGDWRDP